MVAGGRVTLRPRREVGPWGRRASPSFWESGGEGEEGGPLVGAEEEGDGLVGGEVLEVIDVPRTGFSREAGR